MEGSNPTAAVQQQVDWYNAECMVVRLGKILMESDRPAEGLVKACIPVLDTLGKFITSSRLTPSHSANAAPVPNMEPRAKMLLESKFLRICSHILHSHMKLQLVSLAQQDLKALQVLAELLWRDLLQDTSIRLDSYAAIQIVFAVSLTRPWTEIVPMYERCLARGLQADDRLLETTISALYRGHGTCGDCSSYATNSACTLLECPCVGWCDADLNNKRARLRAIYDLYQASPEHARGPQTRQAVCRCLAVVKDPQYEDLIDKIRSAA